MASREISFCLGEVCIGKKQFVCRRIPPNINRVMHWSKKHQWNDAWREEVYYAVRKALGRGAKLPVKSPELSIVFHQTHLMDDDNIYSSAKVLIDALKVKDGAGVIVDDDPKNLKLKVSQLKANHKKDERVEMTLRYELE